MGICELFISPILHNTNGGSSLTKAERNLSRIIEGDSDIDLSDDEDPQAVIEEEEECQSQTSGATSSSPPGYSCSLAQPTVNRDNEGAQKEAHFGVECDLARFR
ncbi:hypothetical protein NQZ68_036258 [Dissostichus eleginoides]|nr:hypothetical protein NQZ68_036258 [Dissostichus eleginoides]